MFFGESLNFNIGLNTQNWCLPVFPSIDFSFFNFSSGNIQNIWCAASNSQNQRTGAKSNDINFPTGACCNYTLPTDQDYTFTASTTRIGQKTKYGSDNMNLDGYNAKAGKKLADIALKNSVGWSGYCARSVKKAIQSANLGIYKSGHAYQMTSILRENKNFKEISADNVDVSNLPAGCVLVYSKGVKGYSKKYGHTEITTGDGRAVSDGITKNLHKKPSAIFIPVERNLYA